MAAIEITISGILYDKQNRTSQQVVLIGDASITGLTIGGGPILPPDRPPVDPPIDPPTNPPSENWVWGWVPSMKAWQPVYVPGPGDPTPHR